MLKRHKKSETATRETAATNINEETKFLNYEKID